MSTAHAEGSAAILEVRDLTKSFGGLTAVNAVSFALHGAGIYGLIGPNGSGKSTTVNLLGGLFRPTSGEISYKGLRIHDMAMHRRRRLGIARTFQSAAVWPNVSALNNVVAGTFTSSRGGVTRACFRRRAEHRDREAAISRAHAALNRVGFRRSPNLLAGTLTFGEQKMVDLARALVSNPTVLILDEPTSGLADAGVEALPELLISLRSAGISVFLIEHDVDLVMRLSDRVTVIDFGRLIANDTPANVLINEDVIAAYLGRKRRS